MLLLAGALDHDGNQLLAANALLDQTADCGLARRVEMADRIQADDALRAQRPIEQVDEALRCRGRLRRLGPAEVPLHQFISFQHALRSLTVSAPVKKASCSARLDGFRLG